METINLYDRNAWVETPGMSFNPPTDPPKKDGEGTVKEEKAQEDVGKVVKGVLGLGISLEIAFPAWIIHDLFNGFTGVGLDFGLIEDKNGLGFYATTKSTKESGVALSASLEVFSASKRLASSNINLTRSYLEGPGYEVSFGAWIFGGAYGVSNAADYNKYSTYQVFSGCIGLGIDTGFVTWDTNTYVTGN